MSTTVLKKTLAAVVLFALCGLATGQQYPNKPIRFIVANAPGGSTSTVARMVGDELTKSWGENVIVDNRGGGDGAIAMQALQRADPDGHTILLLTGSHTVRPTLHPNKEYYRAFLEEIVPVTSVVSTSYVLVVHPGTSVQTVKDVIGLAKAKPGQLKGSVSNLGGTNHLTLELFNVVAGTNIKPIAYKGGGPGMRAVMQGETQLSFGNAITVFPHVKNGLLKAIAVGRSERLASLPQVPTFAESGLPAFKPRGWQGIAMPPGTPDAIANKLAAEVARIRSLPHFKQQVELQGADVHELTREEFRAYIKEEVAMWAKVVKQANIKM
jgi:tripartite-type tricarboxylate transporter receptor subunit TctC